MNLFSLAKLAVVCIAAYYLSLQVTGQPDNKENLYIAACGYAGAALGLMLLRRD